MPIFRIKTALIAVSIVVLALQVNAQTSRGVCPDRSWVDEYGRCTRGGGSGGGMNIIDAFISSWQKAVAAEEARQRRAAAEAEARRQQQIQQQAKAKDASRTTLLNEMLTSNPSGDLAPMDGLSRGSQTFGIGNGGLQATDTPIGTGRTITGAASELLSSIDNGGGLDRNQARYGAGAGFDDKPRGTGDKLVFHTESPWLASRAAKNLSARIPAGPPGSDPRENPVVKTDLERYAFLDQASTQKQDESQKLDLMISQNPKDESLKAQKKAADEEVKKIDGMKGKVEEDIKKTLTNSYHVDMLPDAGGGDAGKVAANVGATPASAPAPAGSDTKIDK